MKSDIISFQIGEGLVGDGIIGPLTMAAMRRVWGLNTVKLSHFLGQAHVETMGFTRKEENLNYSAERLLEVFGKYFTPFMAQRYAGNPVMIANIAYSNRLGNGDICSGDGYKHRGRGLMSLTGRSNYEVMASYIGDHRIVSDPDIVLNEYLWDIGLAYFSMNSIWYYCSAVTSERIRAVTIKVNGGINGLEDREYWTNHYYNMQIRK